LPAVAEGEPVLTFHDKKGKTRATLSIGGLSLFDEEGRPHDVITAIWAGTTDELV
jgi:hypothetical protein